MKDSAVTIAINCSMHIVVNVRWWGMGMCIRENNGHGNKCSAGLGLGMGMWL